MGQADWVGAVPSGYAHFSKLGMFTGSGAIEGGIKALVVQRAKQSGMHWTVEGAADIIALRCQPLRPAGRSTRQDHPQQSWRAPRSVCLSGVCQCLVAGSSAGSKPGRSASWARRAGSDG
jgi:hypothetical protein